MALFISLKAVQAGDLGLSVLLGGKDLLNVDRIIAVSECIDPDDGEYLDLPLHNRLFR